jgi:hypothetical protein
MPAKRSQTPDETPDETPAETPETPGDEVPMSRAERRAAARGRAARADQPHGGGKVHGGKVPVVPRRQYSNRRSGG